MMICIPPRDNLWQGLLPRRAWVAQMWTTSDGAVRLRALPPLFCSGVSVSVWAAAGQLLWRGEGVGCFVGVSLSSSAKRAHIPAGNYRGEGRGSRHNLAFVHGIAITNSAWCMHPCLRGKRIALRLFARLAFNPIPMRGLRLGLYTILLLRKLYGMHCNKG